MSIYAGKNKKRQIILFSYTCSFKSLFIPSLIRIHVEKKNRRNMQGTLYQNFMFVSKKHAECALKISTLQRALGIMHIRTFFSPDRLILRPDNII